MIKYFFIAAFLVLTSCSINKKDNYSKSRYIGCGLNNGGAVVVTIEGTKSRIYLFTPNKAVAFAEAHIEGGRVSDVYTMGGTGSVDAMGRLVRRMIAFQSTSGSAMIGGLVSCDPEVEAAAAMVQ